MSLISMQKIRLVTHASAAADVLHVVQKEGVVEFAAVDDPTLTTHEPTEFEFNYVSARLDFAVDFLSTYEPTRSGLAKALEGSEELVDDKRIDAIISGVYATEVIDAAQGIQKDLNDTYKKVRALNEERAVLVPWQSAVFTVGRTYDTKTTKTFFVAQEKTINTKKETEKHAALTAPLDAAEIMYHLVSVDAQRAVLTYDAAQDERVGAILKEEQYTVVTMEQRRGTPAEEIERINRALVKADEHIAHLEERARDLAAEHLADLKVLSDHTLWQKERHDAFVHAARTENVLVYEGWCVADKVDDLDRALGATTALYTLERIIPVEDEQPPVEIANGGMVQPFESVTRLYGLPGAHDLDPTPYLAGFFFVFFGFCLTDVGYGAILATVTGYLLWRYNVAAGAKMMLELLFLGGVASFIAGIFFGGYLGLDMTKMPLFLQKLQVFDPIANPMPIFYFALALGVVQVMTGLALAIWRGKVYGTLRDAVLDNGPWLFLFVTLIIWGAAKVGAVAIPGAVYLIYAALLGLVLTQGRKEKNIIMKGVKGVMSLYDSVSYFADILSYSRLLALGLATSALAFAVNLIAGMAAGEEGSIGGMVAAAVILVIGHLFNLAINAFGAFIHSARLQFVEFFAKFITGSGRLFVPFKRKERNVVFRV